LFLLSVVNTVIMEKTGSDCTIEIKDFAAQNVTPASPAFYKYVVNPSGDAYKNITFEFKGNTPNFTVNGRFSAIPSSETHDWTGSTLTLFSPKAGNYYFQVFVTVDTQISGTANINYCKNNTAGSNCDIQIVNSSSLTDKFELAKLDKTGQVKLYAIYNVAMKSLLVTLFDQEADKKAQVAASYNRVPNYDSGKGGFDADIIGCNTQYCNKVQAINTKDAVMSQQEYLYDTNNGTWYVAIRASRDANDFSVWFDNVCPGNCSGQGTCGSSGDEYGICKCNANFDIGLTCKPNNQLVEIIILIIIAALVLVSALLGLIAWAYMRRKAQYIEVR